MKDKKPHMISNLLVFGLLLISCCSEEPNPPPEPASYEILWQAPIVANPEREFSLSTNPIVYGNSVVVSSEYTIQGVVEPLLFIDSSTGEITDLWTDYIDGTAAHLHESSAAQDEFLVLKTQRSIDCINLETKETQWSSKMPGSSPWVFVNKSFVYTSTRDVAQKKASILRSPLGSENWETVYSFTSSDRFVPAFSSMGFGQNNNGDKILVWKNRSYTTGNKDRTDIFAYNLDADSLLWRNTDFEIFGGILPLQVENNRVYGIVKRTVFCLDLSTGDSIWTNDFKGIVDNPILSTFDQGAMYLSSQHIIIKGRSSYLVMLEKSNGKLFKVDNDLPDGINDRFTYFEGKLFLASSKLTIVDVQSGEILNDPNIMSDLFRMIESKIAIDPDRRVMYFHNGRVLFCVKIPDNL